jgi:hypothetical protein
MVYIIGDRSAWLDPWSCEPYITFAKSGEATEFPRTELPSSRHILGAEAYPEQSKIVVANFQYSEGTRTHDSTVNVYIYSVEEDFTCTLQNTFTFSAGECSGSGLTGRLCSLDSSIHIVAFGDLSNNPHFTFAAVKTPAGQPPSQSIAHRKPPLYDDIMHVYFKPDGSYYAASAHPVGTDKLVLLVTMDNERYGVFERVVVLPFELGTATMQHLRSEMVTLKRLTTETGEVERVLVRVTIEQERSAEGKLGECRAVAFLLNIPTNEVVCMSVLRKPFSLCAQSADDQSILQLQD